MSSPRCGVHDDIEVNMNKRLKRYITTGVKWPMKDLTYYVKTYSKKLSYRKVDEIVASAFNVWSRYTDLTFTAHKSERSNIIIGFQEYEHDLCLPFDGPWGVLAHAQPPYYESSTGTDILIQAFGF